MAHSCSSDLSSLFFFFGILQIRYLREDKPHGSAGGLYHFRNLIMEDSPVSLQGSYYIESFFFCVLWTKCFFSHLSSYIYFLQSHIFLLNCDVCCSFPLPKMLGIFFFINPNLVRSHLMVLKVVLNYCYF